DEAPLIAFIRANVLAVESMSTVRDEEVGESDGFTTSYLLQHKHVQPKSLKLVVQPPEEGRPEEAWTEVEDFLASKPGDTHYTLNSFTGEVRFDDKGSAPLP